MVKFTVKWTMNVNWTTYSLNFCNGIIKCTFSNAQSMQQVESNVNEIEILILMENVSLDELFGYRI